MPLGPKWACHRGQIGLYKINFQLNMVMLYIKSNGMKHTITRQQIICPYTFSLPLGWGQNVNSFPFMKVVMLHIKLIGMNPRIPCKQLFFPFTRVKKVKTFFSEEGYVAYHIMQLKCTLCIIVYP